MTQKLIDMPPSLWVDAKINKAGYFRVEQFSKSELPQQPINGNYRTEYIRADLARSTLSQPTGEVLRALDYIEEEYPYKKGTKGHGYIETVRTALTAKASVNTQLLEALIALKNAVKESGKMNGFEYDSLGVQVNNAIAAAEKAGCSHEYF